MSSGELLSVLLVFLSYVPPLFEVQSHCESLWEMALPCQTRKIRVHSHLPTKDTASGAFSYANLPQGAHLKILYLLWRKREDRMMSDV